MEHLMLGIRLHIMKVLKMYSFQTGIVGKVLSN